jgi:subtilase family serine protease
MRLARSVAGIPLLGLLAWGCTREAAGPGALPAFSTQSAAQSDFEYIARPPYVQVSPNTAIPNGMPYCRTGSVKTGLRLICYGPSFVRKAYNFPSTLDGSGQTILIVDAFGSPTIAADLARFDNRFGIPAPPSFTILCPEDGCPPFDPTDTHHDEIGWSVETSLDVEYAHAMAPGANIVLVVASTSSGNAINSAEARAIQLYPGSIMSQSFGIPEIVVHANNAQLMQAERNYVAAAQAGITVLASAGDNGAANGFFNIANALFPASDPLVIAVGGTEGDPYTDPSAATLSCAANTTCSAGLATFTGPCSSVVGFLTSPCTPLGYGGERVWNEGFFAPGSTTGGAPSLFFPAPTYQGGLGLSARTTPDVAYNAAIHGGVLVANSSVFGFPVFFIVGGTSAGSPQWAAIIALANQLAGRPLGFLNAAIYKLAHSSTYPNDFHDITVGSNQMPGTAAGFSAGAGWDKASGWGTPNVGNFVRDLVACVNSGSCSQ